MTLTGKAKNYTLAAICLVAALFLAWFAVTRPVNPDWWWPQLPQSRRDGIIVMAIFLAWLSPRRRTESDD